MPTTATPSIYEFLKFAMIYFPHCELVHAFLFNIYILNNVKKYQNDYLHRKFSSKSLYSMLF